MRRFAREMALRIPRIRQLYERCAELEKELGNLRLEQEQRRLRICSICGNHIERYLPLPDYYSEESAKRGMPIFTSIPETLNRIEYSCPVCWASDRDRLYALYLKKLFTRKAPDASFVFLDIAPAGSLSKFISEHYTLDYRSLDLFMENVTYRDDIMNIGSIGDCEIDFFICSHVLEHVTDDRAALSELFRISKPGGSGIVMVPLDLTMRETDEDPDASEDDRWRRFGQGDHVRKYEKNDFLSRLSLAGFGIQQYGLLYFGMDAYWQNGLQQSSMLYVVEK